MSDSSKSNDKTGWHRLGPAYCCNPLHVNPSRLVRRHRKPVRGSSKTPSPSSLQLNGVLQAIVNVGPSLIIHAFIGLTILTFGIVVLLYSLKAEPRNNQVPALLGLAMAMSAIIGGTLFFLSDL
jgi:hypothetical protein